MKKIFSVLIVSFFALLIAGCGETTTQYTPVPQITLERKLDDKNIMKAVTEVNGSLYDNITVYFRNGSTTVGSVSLNYSNPEKKNLTFSNGLQRLNVYYITMTAPSWFVAGTVHIESDYTDGLGIGTYIFNGLIAAWTLN